MMGIDVGTTGTKTALLSADGRLLATAYREYGCTYPQPGWVEQDAAMLLASTYDTAAEVMRKAGVSPADIAGVSFSSQRCCTLFIGSDGALVRPMISWQDNRTPAEVELIRSAVTDAAFYDTSRLPLSTTWMIAKILWLQRNEPAAWARTSKVIQLQDYLLRGWGSGEYVSDHCDAAFFGCWDTAALRWDDRLLSLAGLSADRLPQPLPSGTRIGAVSESVAARTGLAAGTPLCVGGGDQNVAALGAGVITPGLLSVSLGTGGAVCACVREPFHDPARKTMVTNHVSPGHWLVEGYQAGAASVLRWFRDEIADIESAFARSAGKNTYDLLSERIAKAPAGSRGLLLMPYFASAATPRWNSSARGTLVGMTFAHDRDCLTRAFVEGITLEVYDMLQALVRAGVPFDTVHLLGGPTKSDVWNQIQADIYGHTVCTLCNTDAAVTGAAILAGVGVGLFPDAAAGVASLVKVRRTYDPDPDRHALYGRLYALYQSLYSALTDSGFYDRLAEFQSAVSDKGGAPA
jgi:xylulokinase